MDLDLGEKAVCNVKVGGKEYKMNAPTVKQSESYQKNMAKKKDGEMTAFIDLLDELGLPREVSENLDVVQVRRLSEGLLGLVEKK